MHDSGTPPGCAVGNFTYLMKCHLCGLLSLHISFNTACAPSDGTACIGSGNYCPGSYYTGSTCVDGYCRCANNPHRDYCTCLGENLG